MLMSLNDDDTSVLVLPNFQMNKRHFSKYKSAIFPNSLRKRIEIQRNVLSLHQNKILWNIKIE